MASFNWKESGIKANVIRHTTFVEYHVPWDEIGDYSEEDVLNAISDHVSKAHNVSRRAVDIDIENGESIFILYYAEGDLKKPVTDFGRKSVGEICSDISGKTVSGVDIPDSGMDDYLVFKFTDGTELRLRYDWIYEWEVRESVVGAPVLRTDALRIARETLENSERERVADAELDATRGVKYDDDRSVIIGNGYGSSHVWEKPDLFQMKLHIDGKTILPVGGPTVYRCKKCWVIFRHYYHETPDIFDAIKKAGVPNDCGMGVG